MYLLMFLVGGERHIKLWSFLRPQKDGTGASLASKALKMGQVASSKCILASQMRLYHSMRHI